MEGDLGCWLHQCGGRRCDGPVGVRGVRVPGGRCAIETGRHHVAHHSTRKSPRKNWQVCPQPSACCRSVRPTWACRCRVPCLRDYRHALRTKLGHADSAPRGRTSPPQSPHGPWGYPPGSRPGAVARVPESQRIPSNKHRSSQWCECPGPSRGWLGEAPGVAFPVAGRALSKPRCISCRLGAIARADIAPL